MKKVCGVLALLLGSLLAGQGLFLNAMGGNSLGVIGGADGPTAVFVAGRTGSSFALELGAGLLLMLVGIFLLMRGKK